MFLRMGGSEDNRCRSIGIQTSIEFVIRENVETSQIWQINILQFCKVTWEWKIGL